jgi:hypothetical protein
LSEHSRLSKYFLCPVQQDGSRRRLIHLALASASTLILPRLAAAASLVDISDKDAELAVKAMLERGALAAVAMLGRQDGFQANEPVRIPLPDWIPKYERAIKVLGRSKDIEAIRLGVNRAAEQAVAQAKSLLVTTVRALNVQDAKVILGAGDISVSRYFQQKSQAALEQKLLPTVSAAAGRLGLAQQYSSLAEQVQQTGLVALPADLQRIERYVTRKAMEGLFVVIGEEERKIRVEPVATGNELLKRVFGALK